MNLIDRKARKARSKELIRGVQPAIWSVALIYLLATNWVDNLVGLLSPVTSRLNELQLTMWEAVSQNDADALSNAVDSARQIFASTGGYITLLLSVLILLYTQVVRYGFTSYCMQVVRGQGTDHRELFSRFYMAGKIVLAGILQTLITYLGMFAFIAPGIIAYYSYSMVPYCLLDDPDCSVLTAFRRSREMTRGRKTELFVLDLSFLLWILGGYVLDYLVAGLVGGLAGSLLGAAAVTAYDCFLLPYVQLTSVQYYEAMRPRPAENDGVY
ncbi:MAG: DUF975 family protein [Oscillospiraceae bacterium]|nr:DUF975 family protein [Oscillospiraceae bacterium]